MRTQRILLMVVIAATAAAAVACGASSGPEAIEDPRSTPTSSPTADPIADDEVVWQESTAGGFVPVSYALTAVPDVTIYADGRIIAASRTDDGTLRPVALDEATIPADELDDFLAEAADSGLFDPGTDFGQPGVTDMPSTSVTLRTDDGPRTVDVYALDFDIDPDHADVSAEQIARRDELSALLDRARSLAQDPKPYIPDQVRATIVRDGAVDAAAKPVDWPGPPLTSFPAPTSDGYGTSCLVIEGPDAAAVNQAAADNPDGYWNIGGEVHQIVVAPLLPGQEGCPPS